MKEIQKSNKKTKDDSKKNKNQAQKAIEKEESSAKTIENIFKIAKKEKQIRKEEKQVKRDHKSQQLQKKLKIQWRLQQKLRKAHGGQVPTTSRVEGGLKIYSEQQLKIGQGGFSKKCPIDCDCCF